MAPREGGATSCWRPVSWLYWGWHQYQRPKASRTRSGGRASLLEAVFAAALDRITIFDETGQIVRLNPAAKESAGAEREHGTMETVGQAFDLRTVDGQPFPPDELPTARALRGEVVQGSRATDAQASRWW
jgi:PAS domain-containing protein